MANAVWVSSVRLAGLYLVRASIRSQLYSAACSLGASLRFMKYCYAYCYAYCLGGTASGNTEIPVGLRYLLVLCCCSWVGD